MSPQERPRTSKEEKKGRANKMYVPGAIKLLEYLVVPQARQKDILERQPLLKELPAVISVKKAPKICFHLMKIGSVASTP